MLNGLWLGFFVVAMVSALAQWLIGGNAGIFAAMVESIFAMAKLSVEVMVLLFGTLTLWLGFLRIAEKAGIVDWLAKALGPLFRRLMPEVPAGHPAIGLITLNFAANGLGLDNAATPIGLKAMKALQELNPIPNTASNAQILFLVLNASSLTLLPVTIFMYRAQQGAADPTLVFLPILLATSASTLVGLLSVAIMQRLRLWDPVVLAYLIPGALVLGGFMALLATLSATALAGLSSILGNLTLFGLIMLFVVIGALRKVKVYEAFVEGAKEGFDVAKNLLPYLVAMLCAVGVLRASGALDFGLEGIRHVVAWTGMDTRFVDALPTAMVKPFSGSAARAMLIETMQTQGVDSFPALVAATIQGSTETTFYVLALLGACSILPKADPSDTYRLPSAQAAHQGAPVSWSLRLTKPQTSEFLDSPRIAVVPNGDLISSYANSRWSDPAPVLLRNRLLDGFQRDGRVTLLSTDDTNLQADYELGGQLQAFQSEYRGSAVDVLIRLDARLVRGSDQRIIASRRFEVRQAVTDTQVPAVVAAFGQAGDQLNRQVVEWVVQQGNGTVKR